MTDHEQYLEALRLDAEDKASQLAAFQASGMTSQEALAAWQACREEFQAYLNPWNGYHASFS